MKGLRIPQDDGFKAIANNSILVVWGDRGVG